MDIIIIELSIQYFFSLIPVLEFIDMQSPIFFNIALIPIFEANPVDFYNKLQSLIKTTMHDDFIHPQSIDHCHSTN